MGRGERCPFRVCLRQAGRGIDLKPKRHIAVKNGAATGDRGIDTVAIPRSGCAPTHLAWVNCL